MGLQLLILCLALWPHMRSLAAESVDNKEALESPLIFEFDDLDAAKVKIFWDPMVDVRKVLELANREVKYANSSTESTELIEEPGDWRVLVTDQDDDDGTKRYVFLKNSLCDEVDWRVKWVDGLGQKHGPSIYRMPPSPVPWFPVARFTVDNLVYDPTRDAVFAKAKWNISAIGLDDSRPILSGYRPVVDLDQCQYFLKEAAPRPGIMDNGDIVIPGAYGRAGCTFKIRLSVMALNRQMNCRDIFQTVDSASVALDVSCGSLPNFHCSEKKQLPCDMDCSPMLHATADYHQDSNGIPHPIINLEWVSSDRGASYGVHVCVVYQKQCDEKEINWKMVDQTPIFFNKLMDSIPPPPDNTVPPTTTARTSPPSTVPSSAHPPSAQPSPEPSPSSPPPPPSSTATKASKPPGADFQNSRPPGGSCFHLSSNFVTLLFIITVCCFLSQR